MTEPGRIPEKLDFSTIGEVLYRFAEEQEQQLRQIYSKGFWSWAILKETMFHLLLGQMTRKAQEDMASLSVTAASGNRLRILRHVMLFPFLLAGKCLKYRKHHPVLILSNQSDRIMSDEAGRRLNPMFDVLVSHAVTSQKMLTLENAPAEAIPNPAVQPDIYLGPLTVYIRVLSRLMMLSGSEKHQAMAIAELFNNWFRRHHLEASVQQSEVRLMLCRFRASQFIFQIIWKGLQPSLILGSERGATGECAAAKKLGIPVLEFQHGLMDRYYTDYMYPAWMKSNPKAAAAPDALVLFGAVHGEFLSDAGFWEAEQLLPAGSYRVDVRRGKHNIETDQVILYANQWHVFEHASELFTRWLASGWFQRNRWKLNIKLHPLDPPHVRTFFSQLCSEYPETCAFFGTDTDIYQLIPDARVLLGYDSTVLVEAVSLGKPVISIDPGVIEGGLHSYVPFTAGLSSIRLANDLKSIERLLGELTNAESYRSWMAKVEAEGHRIFTPGYVENMKKMLHSWLT